MLGLGDLLNNPLAKTVATAFAGPLAPIGMDLLSSATKGGFDPLQSLLQPFNSLFPQATGLLSNFPSSPAAFQNPFSGTGTPLGDVAGSLNSAFEKLKSLDPFQALEGQKELNAIKTLITAEQEFDKFKTNLEIASIKNING